ncbi:MAG: VanZ family protein [Gemmatimonadota bacterium]
MVLDTGWLSDLLLNIVLFLPFGFIARRIPALSRGSTIVVLLAGLLLSGSIETAQLFLAPRYSTASDLAANGLGAWSGAFLSDLVGRRLGEGRTLIGRLLLDLPLMGFVYLLVPLMWLDGLATGGSPDRLWALVPLVSAGALALAAVAASDSTGQAELEGREHVFSAGLGVAAIFWYLLGAIPAMRAAPTAVLTGALLVVLVTFAARLLWRGAVRHDRRLEPQVVRLLLPLVVLYLTALARSGGELYHAGSGEIARVTILRWLERGAGFTLLGYLVAEWRGRREELLPRTMLAPMLVAALLFAVLTRFNEAPRDVAALVVTLAATAFGALLYAFQRAHILALLGRAEAAGE